MHKQADRYFVQFYGWFESLEYVFLAMQYCPHGDLQRHLDKKLPETEVRDIAQQLLEGLQNLHALGWTHRDLKPQNILVFGPSPRWWVKIGDFGGSKRFLDGQSLQNTVVGTWDYMAPEIRGLIDIEPNDTVITAVDVWSLGCILFQLVVGAVPFSVNALGSYCRSTIPFPLDLLHAQQISSDGGAFIRGLMAVQPRNRPKVDVALKESWIVRGSPDVSPTATLASDLALSDLEASNTATEEKVRDSVTKKPTSISNPRRSTSKPKTGDAKESTVEQKETLKVEPSSPKMPSPSPFLEPRDILASRKQRRHLKTASSPQALGVPIAPTLRAEPAPPRSSARRLSTPPRPKEQTSDNTATNIPRIIEPNPSNTSSGTPRVAPNKPWDSLLPDVNFPSPITALAGSPAVPNKIRDSLWTLDLSTPVKDQPQNKGLGPNATSLHRRVFPQIKEPEKDRSSLKALHEYLPPRTSWKHALPQTEEPEKDRSSPKALHEYLPPRTSWKHALPQTEEPEKDRSSPKALHEFPPRPSWKPALPPCALNSSSTDNKIGGAKEQLAIPITAEAKRVVSLPDLTTGYHQAEEGDLLSSDIHEPKWQILLPQLLVDENDKLNPEKKGTRRKSLSPVGNRTSAPITSTSDRDVQDRDCDALYGAAVQCNEGTLNILLAAGIPIDQEDSSGLTVFNKLLDAYCAVEEGSDAAAVFEKSIMFLLKHGKVFRKVANGLLWTKSPVHLAVRTPNKRLLSLLIESGFSVRVEDNLRNTPLHYACRYGYVEMAEILIRARAHVNAGNDFKSTPLMEIVQYRENHELVWEILPMTKLLLKHGAERFKKDYINRMASHYAIGAYGLANTANKPWRCNYLPVIQLLLDNAPLIDDVPDAYGDTLHSLAQKHNVPNLTEFLIRRKILDITAPQKIPSPTEDVPLAKVEPLGKVEPLTRVEPLPNHLQQPTNSRPVNHFSIRSMIKGAIIDAIL